LKPKSKDEIRSNKATGIFKNVTTLLSKIPKVTLPAIPETYSQTLSKEQKIQVELAELKKARALAEAQRRRMMIY